MKSFFFSAFLSLVLFAQAQITNDSLLLEIDLLLNKDVIKLDTPMSIEFESCRYEMVKIPGGLDSLSNFILSKFDREAIYDSVVGRVYISFIIDTNGFITNAKIARGIHAETDKTCLKLIKSLPQWVPAQDSNGRKVPLAVGIPFRFEGKN